MAIRSGPGPHHELTHSRIVLGEGRQRTGWLPWALLAAVALWLGSHELPGRSGYAALAAFAPASSAGQSTMAPAASAPGSATLQRRLEQSELTLKLAEARSHELERQIDVLNQRLREAQEELAFFHKGRPARNP